MRSIIIVIGDRLGKYLLGTVGLCGTCRGLEGVCDGVLVLTKALEKLPAGPGMV